MKKNIKLTIFSLIISSICLISCKQETDKSDLKQIYTLIDQCFLVRGISGELLDLHILRDKENNVTVRTSLSAISGDTRMLDEDPPDFFVIARGAEFIDNAFVLPKPENNYWIFEASLEDFIPSRAMPGNGSGGNAVLETCDCFGPNKGDCILSKTQVAPDSFTAHCRSAIVNPCSGDGIYTCRFGSAYSNKRERLQTQNTTTIIIESDKIDYNGLLYK